MKNERAKKIVESICNVLLLFLGLACLGDVFDLWSFHPFAGWWVLFLYIPAICGFITKGFTPGGIMLSLTAIVLTIGIFVDVDERLWSVALILYIAYLGIHSIIKNLKAPGTDSKNIKDGSDYVHNS